MGKGGAGGYEVGSQAMESAWDAVGYRWWIEGCSRIEKVVIAVARWLLNLMASLLRVAGWKCRRGLGSAVDLVELCAAAWSSVMHKRGPCGDWMQRGVVLVVLVVLAVPWAWCAALSVTMNIEPVVTTRCRCVDEDRTRQRTYYYLTVPYLFLQ
jgi:hypothetical protein